MSEVKLYKGNECGEILACVERKNEKGMFTWLDHEAKTGCMTKIMLEKYYTPLPEAPTVGSDEWAISSMKRGDKIKRSTWDIERFIWVDDHGNILDQNAHFYSFGLSDGNDWQLHEEPTTIIERLPHEFVEGEEVLVRNFTTDEWLRGVFNWYRGDRYACPFQCDEVVGVTFTYCLPYAGNEHLKGQVTDGKYGAVPKGYVPPRAPKLGDDDYWQVGDEVVNLSNLCNYVIHSIGEHRFELRVEEEKTGDTKFYHVNGKFLGYGGKGLRLLYHKGSYVNPDGTVHEHIPTRPHKILDPDAKT